MLHMKNLYIIAFYVCLSLIVFAPSSSFAAEGKPALVLTQKDGADMFMTCMRGGQKRLYDKAKAADCARLCNFFRRAMHSDMPHTEIEEASKQCRAAYKDTTGEDVQPSVPSTYKPPKGSARGM